jgi:FkbM family methyltransferase
VAVGTVIDVGASDGRWSEIAAPYFPGASFLLVEAQQIHEEALRRLTAKSPGFRYQLAAAGDGNGSVAFDASDPFGGVVCRDGACRSASSVQMRTVDDMVRESGLPGPYLLKLDTHGFEVPIFRGATRTLGQTSLIVVEAYNFTVSPEALRFPDLCRYLEEEGFRCIDLCEPLFRPTDGALWQMDLVFAPKDRREFRSDRFDGLVSEGEGE